jgi:hypothetical protein
METRSVIISAFCVIVSCLIFYMVYDVKEKFVNNNAEIVMLQKDPKEDSIYLFADNKCSPECCLQGSAFSCSKGCVCLTEQQKLGLVRRGNNASSVPPDITTDVNIYNK